MLRLPYELSKRNLKVAQACIERDCTAVKNSLKDTANASLSNTLSPDDVLKNFDSMISRMQGLKRKLEACTQEDEKLRQSSHARLKHVSDLYAINSFEDAEYVRWSRTRLDRLVVDYLLQKGYGESAMALAQRKGIEQLVDIDTFLQLKVIADSLRNHSLTEILAWCSENKKELRRIEVILHSPCIPTSTNAFIE